MKKTVLITGASRGLGYELVKAYLEEGALVYAGVRNPESESLKILHGQYGDEFRPIVLDVSDTGSVKDAAGQLADKIDRLDVLINNAGIHSPSTQKVLEEADIDHGMEVFSINSLGPLRTVQAFLPLLRKSESARIINISSESGSISTQKREKEFDYCMSKAALNMASKLLSNYLSKENIQVFTVHPGWMRTDMGGPRATLHPYETACRIRDLFNQTTRETPLFIDYMGQEFPW